MLCKDTVTQPMTTATITQLLDQARSGDKQAMDDVYQLLYGEIKSIAGFHLKQLDTGQTITPTVLAHECYLKINQANPVTPENKRHFLNYLSTSMRRYLIDVLRAKKSLKRDQQSVDMGMTEFVGDEDVAFHLMEIDLMLNRIEAIDAPLAELLQYKLILNFTFSEMAEIVNMSERHVRRRWKQGSVLLLSMLKQQKQDNQCNR